MMKKLLCKTWAKILAIALFVLALIGAGGSIAGLSILQMERYDVQNKELILRDAMEHTAYNTANDVLYHYYELLRLTGESDYNAQRYAEKYSEENSNFSFTLTDSAGNVVLENYKTSDPLLSVETSADFPEESTRQTGVIYFETPEEFDTFSPSDFFADSYILNSSFHQNPDFDFDAYFNASAWESEEDTASSAYMDAAYAYTQPDQDRGTPQKEYTVYTDTVPEHPEQYAGYAVVEYCDYENITLQGAVRSNLSAPDSFYYVQFFLSLLLSLRQALVPILILSLALLVLSFLFLMKSAGRRPGTEEIRLHFWDAIPLDVYFGIVCVLAVIAIAFTGEMLSGFTIQDPLPVIGLLLFLAAVLIWLFLSFCISCAARGNAGKWWRNTVIYMVLRAIGKGAARLARGGAYLVRNRSLFQKGALVYIALSVVELIVIAADSCTGIAVGGWFLEKILVTPVLFLVFINLRKLQEGGKKIAEGDVNFSVDTRHMFWDFKKHGENLNSITQGLQKAVDERMKSERFKTELITNVSHDIKTPLTSIINYVDLLKKEDIQPDKAKDYVEVLDRQSSRLKKLTEDLVEASKASTGNIQANLEPTNLNVLLQQTAGEYAEKLKSAHLELLLTANPEESTFIFADGKLLWRVFDNLMNNVCKYALEHTRVYVDFEKRGGKVAITFKNISKYPLNIPGEELMERFVRGDLSRNTEGSGLGLSIAQSLTRLQNGTFALSIDGDLFKAIVTFDEIIPS